MNNSYDKSIHLCDAFEAELSIEADDEKSAEE
jgi:hypothetical protein